MSYRQIHEILEKGEELKNTFAEFCALQHAAENDEIIKGIYSKTLSHMTILNRVLAHHHQTASPAVLNTWIQYPGYDELEEAIQKLRAIPPEERPSTGALEQLLEAENTFLKVLEMTTEQARAPSVREYMRSLLDVADEAVRTLGREDGELEDLGDYRQQ